jgi:GntR family transcriptional regulator
VLLRFAIKVGTIPNGVMLKERSLMENFDFSRAAIRDALVRLSKDRLVHRQTAIGTIVTSDPVAVGLFDFTPVDGARKVTFRHTEAHEIDQSDYLSFRLGRETQRVIMTETDFIVDGRKVGIQTAFSTTGGGSSDFGLGVVGEFESWSVTFPREYGVEFGGCEVSIDARVADEDLARILEIEPGEAVLVREQVLYDADGKIWEYGYAQFRSDAVIFRSKSR